jgi:hypothetical protein
MTFHRQRHSPIHRELLLSLGVAITLAAQSASAGAPAAPPLVIDAGPPETSVQRADRTKYIADSIAKENALMKGLVWTPEVRKVASAHWRRAYRTLRIRELAQDSGDTTTVMRTEMFLRKIDGSFFSYLSQTAPTLPTMPAAPTLNAPAANVQIPIGSALAITMTPAPSVTPTEYWCVASEGGASALVNYDPTTKHYGTTPTCTFAATDPRWAKFVAKKGGIWVATGTKTKSPKGVEYTQWSAERYIPVQFTGAALAGAH